MGERPRQTGLLGQSPQHPIHQSGGHRRLEKAPAYLLFQIGKPPGPITTIGAALQDRLILGRDDPPSGYVPEVNLAPYGAGDQGVSRRHLAIIRHDNILYIEDLGSRNGSKLNGEALKPEEEYPLNDGDMLMLGGLQMVIWYID